jgi:putative transcriptional regulator
MHGDNPMDIKVIRWKLNELMAQKRVKNKDLAEALGITENSVYRLRKTDTMPRLTPERLDGICTFLDCQPGELLERVINNEGDTKLGTTLVKQKSYRDSTTQPSSFQEQNANSLFIVLLERSEIHTHINEEVA